MISKIKLNGGKILYNYFNLNPNVPFGQQISNFDEDMLSIAYPSNYLVDVGCYGKEDNLFFRIVVIEYSDWMNPLFKREVYYPEEIALLPDHINTAIRLVSCLLKSKPRVNKDRFINNLNLLDGEIASCHFDIDTAEPFDKQGEKYKSGLLSISFENHNYAVDVSWLPEYDAQGSFITTVFKAGNFENPISTMKTKDIQVLIDEINESIRMASSLNKSLK